jgi:hypothetical protein
MSETALSKSIREAQRLVIPCSPPSLNDLIDAHAFTFGKGKSRSNGYQKIKKHWANVVAVAVRKCRLRPVDACSLHFHFSEKDRRRDPDNIASGGAKVIIDGLVKAGVLKGDGWATVKGLSFTWSVGAPRTTVVIYEPPLGSAADLGRLQ